jgi:hypothetical protein
MGPISENKASKWCRRTELVGGKVDKDRAGHVDLAVLLLLLLLMIAIVVLY